MIPAGERNEKIAFESRGERIGAVDRGNSKGPFAHRFNLNARRKSLRGTETVIAARLQGQQPVVFTVLASSKSREITTEWRIKDRAGVFYAIKGITLSDDRSEFDILAQSGIAS
jgi:hypothetical protein